MNTRLCQHIALLLMMLVCLSGCNSTQSPEEMFEENKSGVVLILNQYYYRMKLPNGNYTYFTNFDKEGNLDFCSTVDEIKNNKITIFGTGFFIDGKGTIMTNRHVAQPEINKTEVKNQFNELLKGIKSFYTSQLQSLGEQYAELENKKRDCIYTDYAGNTYVDNEQLATINSAEQELSDQYDEIVEARDNIMEGNISLDELKIETVCEIGIAYDDTYISSYEDFLKKNPCVVTKVSEKENVDLALLQLKNKKTPETAHVFTVGQPQEKNFMQKAEELFSTTNKDILHIDQDLYMIGYNAGPIVANTKQGIKVQMTSGKVTQSPDGERLLYSIPTVQGSSGSPVLDADGNVVAVNFAKLAVSDNFNFGIPLNKVKAFLEQ